MSEWYESAVASHFLLEIGYRNGVHGTARGHAVLLHQNPLDQMFGDAAGHQSERYFLLEFKRDEAGTKSERTKRLRLDLLRLLREGEQLFTTPELEQVRGGIRNSFGILLAGGQESAQAARLLYAQSRQGHWLGWGVNENDALEMRIEPYVRLLESKETLQFFDGAPAFLDALDAAGRSAPDSEDSSGDIGWTYNDFCNYTARMCALAEVEDTDGGSDGTEVVDETPGIVGCASSTLGLVALPFRGTRDLVRMLRMSKSLSRRIESKVERVRAERLAFRSEAGSEDRNQVDQNITDPGNWRPKLP